MTYNPSPANSLRPKTAETLKAAYLKLEPTFAELDIITTSRCYPIAYHYILQSSNPADATLRAFSRFQLSCVKFLNKQVTVITTPNHLELCLDGNFIKVTRCQQPPSEYSRRSIKD
jgi:hypothetical protein